MSSEKGSVILLTVVGVATLLVAVAGTTFAYFGAAESSNESSTIIEVKGEKIKTNFTNGNSIQATGVQTGEIVASKTFTVNGTISGSSNSQYEAILNVTDNTYSDGALVYTLTSTNDSQNGSTILATTQEVAIPTGTNTIVLGKGTFAGPVSTGATHTYTLTIKYVGNMDSDKTFSAVIDVD